jgi:NADPH2:quinone reductase
MQAIRVHQQGGPEMLTYESVSTPDPEANAVRVNIEAAGLNFIDIYHRTGLYPREMPFIPGSEAAGVVDALGSSVSEFQVGDRVAYTGSPGAYAEYGIVPADSLVKIPAAIDTRTAAAVMLQGLTAHYLAHTTYPIQPGDTALIHAAAGGVGLLLVQLAKKRGATIIATVSTEEKAALARQAGADEVILYTQADFEAETMRLTDGQGVPVVYDSVGKATFDKSMNCLCPRGYLVLYGQASGPVDPVDPGRLNRGGSLFLTRPSLGHHVQTRAELLQRTDDLFTWIANGELDVRIDRTFPLAEAKAAHEYMEARRTRGKVLLIP